MEEKNPSIQSSSQNNSSSNSSLSSSRSSHSGSSNSVPHKYLAARTELIIPGDHSCLFWSVALGVLIPVLDDNNAYQQAFNRLFVSNDKDAQLFHQHGDGLKERIKVFLSGNDMSFIERNDQEGEDPLYGLINDYFRQKIANYIATHPLEYTPAILECNNDDYVAALRNPDFWGGQIEIHAIFHMLNQDYQIEVEGGGQDDFLAPGKPVIRLIYANAKGNPSGRKNHYNLRMPDIAQVLNQKAERKQQLNNNSSSSSTTSQSESSTVKKEDKYPAIEGTDSSMDIKKEKKIPVDDEKQ